MKKINWDRFAELIWHIPLGLLFIWAGVEVWITGSIRQIMHFAVERDFVGGILVVAGCLYLYWVYNEITRPVKKKKKKRIDDGTD